MKYKTLTTILFLLAALPATVTTAETTETAGIQPAAFDESGATERASADDWSYNYQDRHLRQRVLLRLYESPSLAGSTFDLDMVDDGVAELRGSVASDVHRERAVRLARQTLGIYQVMDQLDIDPERVDTRIGLRPADDVLAERAASTLADVFETAEARKAWRFGYEIDGYSWDFDVDVNDGVASLNGTVSRLGHILKAAKTVWELPGVRAVKVELEVEDDDAGFWPDFLRSSSNGTPRERLPLTPPINP